jgi:hypothetical protein
MLATHAPATGKAARANGSPPEIHSKGLEGLKKHSDTAAGAYVQVTAPAPRVIKKRQPQAAVRERKAFLLGHLDVDAPGTDSEQLRHAELLWLSRYAPLDEVRCIARCRKGVEAKLRAAQRKRWRYEREWQECRIATALKVERERIVSALKSRLDGLTQVVDSKT